MGWEHVLPQFIIRATEQISKHPSGTVPFKIQGDGSQTRAFIYIDDFTEGLLKVLESGEHLNIYNIGAQNEITIREVAEMTVKYFGREAEIICSKNEAAGGTNRRCPDISKLKSLGFKPKFSFQDGLKFTADWYAKNAHLEP
jgi:dTDP-glucose 4,6-dehydratase/UDP-glucose 4-epimerase